MVPLFAFGGLIDYFVIGELGASVLPAWLILLNAIAGAFATVYGWGALRRVCEPWHRTEPLRFADWAEAGVFVGSQIGIFLSFGFRPDAYWSASAVTVFAGLVSLDCAWIRARRDRKMP